jgi:DNA repair protein RadA/Sms
MTKTKINYACSECGSISGKWAGQCADCGQWNTMTEIIVTNPKARQAFQGYAGLTEPKITAITEVPVIEQTRYSSGMDELNRVLGGGLVPGSVILIGGDPGIGKSTLLLQSLSYLALEHNTLYVTGEESLHQVRLRAERLDINKEGINLLTETRIEAILQLANQINPKIMVLDSIQTMYTELLQSSPGSVGQVRESTALLVRYAKQTNTILFLVGHVTKEGAIAGPRVLEHMVDTVLYFEGDPDSKYRIIRAVKNRFGAVNEMGIFAMTDKGLKVVNNPSAIFLSSHAQATAGSLVMATWEGTRPMLIEIQALVDESKLINPRRVVIGFDPNRLALMLAVLNRHGGIITYNQDVFVNVVGGVRVTETAIDLPVILAVISSLKNIPFPRDLVVFGEVGLSGEIRPSQSGQERLKEAMKLGFTKAIIPYDNAPRKELKGIQVTSVKHVREALLHIN